MKISMLCVASAALFASGCFQLAATKKCNEKTDKIKELIVQMDREGRPAENVAGRWVCVSAAYPDQREFWRISQTGNRVRVVATTSRGQSWTVTGAVSGNRFAWATKGSGSGGFIVEGDALIGKHNHIGTMSCQEVDFNCTRN